MQSHHLVQVPGAGGLPTGMGGRAAVLLSGGIDSPVAGYMIAKRGVDSFNLPYSEQIFCVVLLKYQQYNTLGN